MNITFLITCALLLTAAALFLNRKFRARAGEYFVNAALIVNITPKGRATRLADAAFTARYLLCKAGSDASHIDICGAADIPLGVVPDMTPTSDAAGVLTYPLPVNFLGLNEDSERMIASGVIAANTFVVADAGGMVKALPVATGTYYVVGKTLSAAVALNDQVEVIPCFPIINRVP